MARVPGARDEDVLALVALHKLKGEQNANSSFIPDEVREKYKASLCAIQTDHGTGSGAFCTFDQRCFILTNHHIFRHPSDLRDAVLWFPSRWGNNGFRFQRDRLCCFRANFAVDGGFFTDRSLDATMVELSVSAINGFFSKLTPIALSNVQPPFLRVKPDLPVPVTIIAYPQRSSQCLHSEGHFLSTALELPMLRHSCASAPGSSGGIGFQQGRFNGQYLAVMLNRGRLDGAQNRGTSICHILHQFFPTHCETDAGRQRIELLRTAQSLADKAALAAEQRRRDDAVAFEQAKLQASEAEERARLVQAQANSAALLARNSTARALAAEERHLTQLYIRDILAEIAHVERTMKGDRNHRGTAQVSHLRVLLEQDPERWTRATLADHVVALATVQSVRIDGAVIFPPLLSVALRRHSTCEMLKVLRQFFNEFEGEVRDQDQSFMDGALY